MTPSTWLYALIGALALGIGYVFLLTRRVKRRRASEHAAARHLLHDVYSNSPFSPELRIGNTYGWSTFQVRFRSRRDRDAARDLGYDERFRQGIASIHQPSTPSFDADLATTFLYNGWEEEIKSQFEEQDAQNRAYTEKWNRENPHNQYPVPRARDDA